MSTASSSYPLADVLKPPRNSGSEGRRSQEIGLPIASGPFAFTLIEAGRVDEAVEAGPRSPSRYSRSST